VWVNNATRKVNAMFFTYCEKECLSKERRNIIFDIGIVLKTKRNSVQLTTKIILIKQFHYVSWSKLPKALLSERA
jgi:hypothetical protein